MIPKGGLKECSNYLNVNEITGQVILNYIVRSEVSTIMSCVLYFAIVVNSPSEREYWQKNKVNELIREYKEGHGGFHYLPAAPQVPVVQLAQHVK